MLPLSVSVNYKRIWPDSYVFNVIMVYYSSIHTVAKFEPTFNEETGIFSQVPGVDFVFINILISQRDQMAKLANSVEH